VTTPDTAPAPPPDAAVTGRQPWAQLSVTASSRFAPAPPGQVEDAAVRWQRVTTVIEQAQHAGVYDDLGVVDVTVYVHDWEFAVITLIIRDGRAQLATRQFTDDDLAANLPRGKGHAQARALLAFARTLILSALGAFESARAAARSASAVSR
jgi:hypothetical protein